ncbi:MAG: hypothetical protein WAK93_21725 [Solirubrobacteraceae bacterium]
MQCARDDYLLKSRWGHVPRTPRAGPRRPRHEVAAVEQTSAKRGLGLRRLLPQRPDRPRSRKAAGELDIQTYLELEFAVDDERTATH